MQLTEEQKRKANELLQQKITNGELQSQEDIDAWKSQYLEEVKPKPVQAQEGAPGQEDAIVDTASSSAPGSSDLQLKDDEEIGGWENLKNNVQNVYNRILGFDDRLALAAVDTFETLLGEDAAKSLYKAMPTYDSETGEWLDTPDEVREAAYRELDKTQAKNKKTVGLIDSWENGDAGQVVSAAAGAGLNILSTMTTSLLTLGAGLYTDMVADAIADANDTKAKRMGISVPELYDRKENEFMLPASVGVAGGLLERMGVKGVSKYISSVASKNIGGALLAMANNSGKEGLTEWLQYGLETYNNEKAKGNDDAAQKALDNLFTREGAEMALQGAVGALVGGQAGKAGKRALGISQGVAQTPADELSEVQDTPEYGFDPKTSESKYKSKVKATEDAAEVGLEQEEVTPEQAAEMERAKKREKESQNRETRRLVQELEEEYEGTAQELNPTDKTAYVLRGLERDANIKTVDEAADLSKSRQRDVMHLVTKASVGLRSAEETAKLDQAQENIYEASKILENTTDPVQQEALQLYIDDEKDKVANTITNYNRKVLLASPTAVANAVESANELDRLSTQEQSIEENGQLPDAVKQSMLDNIRDRKAAAYEKGETARAEIEKSAAQNAELVDDNSKYLAQLLEEEIADNEKKTDAIVAEASDLGLVPDPDGDLVTDDSLSEGRQAISGENGVKEYGKTFGGNFGSRTEAIQAGIKLQQSAKTKGYKANVEYIDVNPERPGGDTQVVAEIYSPRQENVVESVNKLKNQQQAELEETDPVQAELDESAEAVTQEGTKFDEAAGINRKVATAEEKAQPIEDIASKYGYAPAGNNRYVVDSDNANIHAFTNSLRKRGHDISVDDATGIATVTPEGYDFNLTEKGQLRLQQKAAKVGSGPQKSKKQYTRKKKHKGKDIDFNIDESGRAHDAEGKFVPKSQATEVARVKTLPLEAEDGATFNLDGTVYEDGGLVVPIASKNMKASELTDEAIESFKTKYKDYMGPGSKVGIYKFPGQDQVSIDLNVIAPASKKDAALAIGKRLGQESLFDLDTFENIKTGETGANPVNPTAAQARNIAEKLGEPKGQIIEQTEKEITGFDEKKTPQLKSFFTTEKRRLTPFGINPKWISSGEQITEEDVNRARRRFDELVGEKDAWKNPDKYRDELSAMNTEFRVDLAGGKGGFGSSVDKADQAKAQGGKYLDAVDFLKGIENAYDLGDSKREFAEDISKKGRDFEPYKGPALESDEIAFYGGERTADFPIRTGKEPKVLGGKERVGLGVPQEGFGSPSVGFPKFSDIGSAQFSTTLRDADIDSLKDQLKLLQEERKEFEDNQEEGLPEHKEVLRAIDQVKTAIKQKEAGEVPSRAIKDKRGTITDDTFNSLQDAKSLPNTIEVGGKERPNAKKDRAINNVVASMIPYINSVAKRNQRGTSFEVNPEIQSVAMLAATEAIKNGEIITRQRGLRSFDPQNADDAKKQLGGIIQDAISDYYAHEGAVHGTTGRSGKKSQARLNKIKRAISKLRDLGEVTEGVTKVGGKGKRVSKKFEAYNYQQIADLLNKGFSEIQPVSLSGVVRTGLGSKGNISKFDQKAVNDRITENTRHAKKRFIQDEKITPETVQKYLEGDAQFQGEFLPGKEGASIFDEVASDADRGDLTSALNDSISDGKTPFSDILGTNPSDYKGMSAREIGKTLNYKEIKGKVDDLIRSMTNDRDLRNKLFNYVDNLENKSQPTTAIKDFVGKFLQAEAESLGKTQTPSQELDFNIEEGSATRVTDTGVKAGKQVNSHRQPWNQTAKELNNTIRNTNFDNDWVQWSPGQLGNLERGRAKGIPDHVLRELNKQPARVAKLASKHGLKLRQDTRNPGVYHIYKPGKIGSKPDFSLTEKEAANTVADKDFINKMETMLNKAWPNHKVVTDPFAVQMKIGELQMNGIQAPWSKMKGFVVGNKVYLTGKAGYDTPIHEFAHVWAKQLMTENPKLWKRGVELLKGSEYARAVYNVPTYKEYLKGNPSKFWEEVMANAIGKRGAVLFQEKAKQNAWNKWMDSMTKWLKDKLGISSKKDYQNLTLDDWLNIGVHGTVSGKTPKAESAFLSGSEVEYSIADKTISAAKIEGIKNEPKWWTAKGLIGKLVPPAADDYHGLITKIGGIVPKSDLKKLTDAFVDGHQKYADASTDVRKVVKDANRALKKAGIKLGAKNVAKVEGNNVTAAQAIQAAVNGIDNDFANKPAVKRYINTLTEAGVLKPKDTYDDASPQADIVSYVINDLYKEHLGDFVNMKNNIFNDKVKKEIISKKGEKFSEALNSALQRMSSGKNSEGYSGKTTGRWNDWMLGSVGNIMFLNGRSAALQLLSVGNYATATKNPGAFFANFFNPRTYAKAKELYNSKYLKERRARAGFDVNANEMMDMVTSSKSLGELTKKILNAGFVATSVVDSIAISFGGAAFMASNGGDTPANRRAWIEQTEEAQQSSRPDRVSQWQTEGVSKYVLAFANTPQQYFRLVQKAGREIKSAVNNPKLSMTDKWNKIKGPLFRIGYYGAIQNLIFSSLQAASGALLGFDDEGDDEEEIGLIMGAASTMLRGMGMYGAIIDTAKNVIMEGMKQEGKARPDHISTALKTAGISPPFSRKLNQLLKIGRAYNYNRDDKELTLGLQGAAFVTNLPTDFVQKYINNVNAISSDKYAEWQELLMILGWTEYNFKDKGKAGEFDIDDLDLDLDLDLDIDLDLDDLDLD